MNYSKVKLYIILSILLVSCVYAINDNDERLILWAKMDDTAGTITNSKNNDLYGPTLKYNGALNQRQPLLSYSTYSIGFDGSDDAAVNYTLGGNFTSVVNFVAGCYVNDTDGDGLYGTLSMRRDDGGANTGFVVLRSTDGGGQIQFAIGEGDGSAVTITAGSVPKQYYLITIVNGTTGYIYYNDTFQNKGTISALGWDGRECLILGARDNECDTTPNLFLGGSLDECFFLNGTVTQAELVDLVDNGIQVADTTPPTNSSWNVTNNDIFSENGSVWNTGGEVNISSNILTGKVTTNENANGSCRLDVEQNYNEMINVNINYKLATTETTDHSFTLYDNISVGTHCLYCSFIDSDSNEPSAGTSTSGCLNLTYWGSMNVTLNKPENNTNVTASDFIEFNFTVVYHNAHNVSKLYTNFSTTWQLNQTLTGVTNLTETNFTKINMTNGTYVWNVESCNLKVCNFSSVNFTFTRPVVLRPAELISNFHPGISELVWPIDFDVINWTDLYNNATHNSGNYTWNLTEYNVTAYNLTTWLFNVTNSGDLFGNVTLKQNQTRNYYEFWCQNDTGWVNITNVPKFLFNLTSAESKLINCTLNAINISQTYVNWSVSLDNSKIEFNWTFNTTG